MYLYQVLITIDKNKSSLWYLLSNRKKYRKFTSPENTSSKDHSILLISVHLNNLIINTDQIIFKKEMSEHDIDVE